MKKILFILIVLCACHKEKSTDRCEKIRDIGVEYKDSSTTYYIYTDNNRYKVSKGYADSVKQGDYYCK